MMTTMMMMMVRKGSQRSRSHESIDVGRQKSHEKVMKMDFSSPENKATDCGLRTDSKVIL